MYMTRYICIICFVIIQIIVVKWKVSILCFMGHFNYYNGAIFEINVINVWLLLYVVVIGELFNMVAVSVSML